jgi:ABC-type long-subunit fatty acid transport system fused permease/ATPase subunit
MIGEHLFLPPYMALKHIISHKFLYIAHPHNYNAWKNLESAGIIHQFWHEFLVDVNILVCKWYVSFTVWKAMKPLLCGAG